MASSGSVQQPRLVLLMLLLAGAARASLYFRPGQTCYRPLRGDQLAQLGRRWAPGCVWGGRGHTSGPGARPLPPGTLLLSGHPASLGLGNLIPSFGDDFHIRRALVFAGLRNPYLSGLSWWALGYFRDALSPSASNSAEFCWWPFW